MPIASQPVNFNSKLLLFGEYSIIHGGAGLSIPVARFYGRWGFNPGKMDWEGLFKYLSTTEWISSILFDEKKLKADIEKGLHFDSNIPMGYGLGSSAAITAAIFDTYFTKKEQLEIETLHRILAQIESYFHGQSSGLDPLVSYLNQEIIIHSKNPKDQSDIELLTGSLQQDHYKLFLYDTKTARNTKELVASHKQRYADDPVYSNSFKVLDQLNQQAITAFRAQDPLSLCKYFKAISDFQMEHMSAMIPDAIAKDYKSLNLKICGAGGGGYFLGLCLKHDVAKLETQYPIIVL